MQLCHCVCVCVCACVCVCVCIVVVVVVVVVAVYFNFTSIHISDFRREKEININKKTNNYLIQITVKMQLDNLTKLQLRKKQVHGLKNSIQTVVW